MNASPGNNTDKESSGFVDDITAECSLDFDSLIPDKFSDLSQVYISKSGQSRLLSATRYGKRFILKCLKDDFKYIPFYQLALAKEFEVSIALDHPNIAKTISIEDVPGLGKAIVMEYVDGDNLRNIMESRDITPRVARSIAIQLAGALEYLHSKQIVHRDIKPENVMVTHSGNVVKLIDFNLADSSTFTMIKLPAGTRNYMAPEQLLPGAKPDVKADIYSFGMLLHELGEKAGDRVMTEVARRCTSTNPDGRVQSVADLDLSAALANEAATRRGSLLGSKALTILLAIVLAVLSVTAACIAWQRSAEPQQQSVPEQSDAPEVMDSSLWSTGV